MIRTTDLFPDENELDKILKKLLEAKDTLSALRAGEIENAKKLRKQIDGLSESQTNHRDQIADTAAETDKIEKALKKYNEGLSNNSVKLAAVRQATAKVNQVNKLEAKLLASKEGSYNRLSAQYSLNKIALNQMSAEERSATKAGKELEKQTADIYEEMKRLQEATGKHTLSVGDYGKALRETPLGGFADGLEDIKGKFTLLARHPIVAVIGLLAGAVVGLFKAFKKTEKGAEFFAKASGLANAALGVLTSLVDGLVSGLVAMWENPKEAMQNFGKALVENIINRIKGTITLAVKLGETLYKAVTLQFDDAKKAAGEAGEAFVQAFTGLDKVQLQQLTEAIKDTVTAVEKETNAYIKLESAKRRIRKVNRELTRSLEDVTTALALSGVAAGDATTSFKLQEEAAEDVRVKLQEKAEIELKIAKNNLALLNQELRLRRAAKQDVEDLADAQLDAFREVKAAERELTVAIRENDKERAQLRQDRLERDLDILIDGFDNQKTINEKMIADDLITLRKRIGILNETKELSDKSFSKQIETIQKFTKVQIDANDLIQESDAVTLNGKIRALGLSEIIEGRLLEVIRDRKSANRDLIESEQDLAKEIDKARIKVASVLPAKPLGKTMADIKEQLAKEVKKLGEEAPKISIFDKIFGTDQKELVVNSFDEARQAAISFFDTQSERSQKALEESNQSVATKTTELAALASLAAQGYAVNVEQAEKELALEKKQQARRQQQAKRAMKQQQVAAAAIELINSKEQISNMITATSKIWKKVGFPAALPAIALMWGSFAASKIQAVRASKKKFSKGGYEVVGGGSHASGNDTYFGTNAAGEAAYAERNEGHIIVTPEMTRRYSNTLPAIAKHANNGTLEQMLYAAGPSIDTSRLEGHMKQVAQNTERRITVDGQGRKLEQYKNLEITYND